MHPHARTEYGAYNLNCPHSGRSHCLLASDKDRGEGVPFVVWGKNVLTPDLPVIRGPGQLCPIRGHGGVSLSLLSGGGLLLEAWSSFHQPALPYCPLLLLFFCFGTGLTLLYFDSMTQKRTGHQFSCEISYVIIAFYTTSACLFITGPMTLSTLRYVQSAELLTALIIKGVLLVSFVCFKIVFRRAMPADKVSGSMGRRGG